jgi:hypothetical protein
LFTFFNAPANDSDMPLDRDWLFHRNVPAFHGKIRKTYPILPCPLILIGQLDNFKGEKNLFHADSRG